MALIYWHNPRCSTSRKGLELLAAHGVTPQIRLYLQDPPCLEELQALNLPAAELVRWKSVEGLSKDSDEAVILAKLVADPSLIERPILISAKGAVVGRPVEKLLRFL